MSDILLGQLEQTASSLLRFGDVVTDTDATLTLSVDGVTQTARWAQWYTPAAGDAVAFLVTAGAEGQSSILVLGKVAATPLTGAAALPDEARVISVPASSPTITVTAAGVTMTAKYVGNAPAVGDTVLLEHRPTAIYAVGKVGITAAPPTPAPTTPPSPPAPPPSASTTGTATFGTTDSGTARVAGPWHSTSGQHLTQGTSDGIDYAGSWFYGTGPASLAGRSLTSARLYLPARRRLGKFETTTIHLYAHTSTDRPPTDVTRATGPTDIVLPAGWGGGWIDIPAALAAVVVSGGGLGIAGDPYAGLIGRGEDPQSGALAITWTS